MKPATADDDVEHGRGLISGESCSILHHLPAAPVLDAVESVELQLIADALNRIEATLDRLTADAAPRRLPGSDPGARRRPPGNTGRLAGVRTRSEPVSGLHAG